MGRITEDHWISNDAQVQVIYLRSINLETGRKSRLLVSHCLKRVRHLITIHDFQNAIDLLEEFADHKIDQSELINIQHILNAHDIYERSYQDTKAGPMITFNTHQILDAVLMALATEYDFGTATNVLFQTAANPQKDFYRIHRSPSTGIFPDELHQAAQSDLIREIFGNPFRPIDFQAEWRTDDTVALAQSMYNSNNFLAMPVLADALEEAGCDHEAILSHCREQRKHVRGCWVVDFVLGRHEEPSINRDLQKILEKVDVLPAV